MISLLAWRRLVGSAAVFALASAEPCQRMMESIRRAVDPDPLNGSVVGYGIKTLKSTWVRIVEKFGRICVDHRKKASVWQPYKDPGSILALLCQNSFGNRPERVSAVTDKRTSATSCQIGY